MKPSVDEQDGNFRSTFIRGDSESRAEFENDLRQPKPAEGATPRTDARRAHLNTVGWDLSAGDVESWLTDFEQLERELAEEKKWSKVACEMQNRAVDQREAALSATTRLGDSMTYLDMLKECLLWLKVGLPFLPDNKPIDDTNRVTGERLAIRPLPQVVRQIIREAEALIAAAPPQAEQPGAREPANGKMMGLLQRLSAWDMMDTAADGEYWRGEIARVLKECFPSDSEKAG